MFIQNYTLNPIKYHLNKQKIMIIFHHNSKWMNLRIKYQENLNKWNILKNKWKEEEYKSKLIKNNKKIPLLLNKHMSIDNLKNYKPKMMILKLLTQEKMNKQHKRECNKYSKRLIFEN